MSILRKRSENDGVDFETVAGEVLLSLLDSLTSIVLR